MHVTTAAIVAVCLALGCGGGDRAESEAERPAKESSRKAKAKGSASAGADLPEVPVAGWKWLVMDKLGILALVPEDAKSSRLGGISAMNYQCQAMMNQAKATSPSFENILQNIEKGHRGGTVKEMIQRDKTDSQNFVIEYSTTKGKWGYESRRALGHKIISCGRVSSSPEGHACVVSVCESLRTR